MKKKLMIVLVAAISLFSCNKVLDTKPLDAFTSEAVWGSYDLAEGYIYTCYANSLGSIFSWNYDCITKSILNLDWGSSGRSEKTEQIDRNSDMGWSDFGNIRRVNVAIANLKTANFTPDQKNKLLGEAYFLRSAIYYKLTQRFGGVQIVKEPLTPSSDFNIPRSTTKQAYDFVLADLDEAANLLPADNQRGRATKGAAYALSMRVALQAGAYLNDNAYYQKVIAKGNLLFALGYSLDEYSNLFNGYSTAVSSPENILVHERLKTNTDYSGTPMQSLVTNSDNVASKLTPAALAKYPLVESFEGWCWAVPTQDLVDDYLVTDADGKEKKWDATAYITNGANANAKMYQKRDKRFYASIAYDSTMYFKNRIFTRADGNVSSNIAPLYGGCTSGAGTKSGYLFSKYVYQDKKLWYSDPVDFCYSVLRLGEAYLNYAEAALKLGDEATARTYIQKTYQKHGGFTNTITASAEDLWTLYKRERHVEMILENGDRYWSLLRWGMQVSGGLTAGYENNALAIPELNGQLHGMAISADGKSYQVYALNEGNSLPLKFTPKRYLYPVPNAKIQASNNLLTQNAGW